MKVSAQELDRLILLIPRLTRKQLDRLDTLIHEETLRKANGDLAKVKKEYEQETPA